MKKDILQSDYANLKLDSSISQSLYVDLSGNLNPDNLLINKPKELCNLDNFVKKINVDIEEKFLPTRRIANINDPKLKIKGVKRKYHYNILCQIM